MQITERKVRATLRNLQRSPGRLLSHDEMVLLHSAWSAGVLPEECHAMMIDRNLGLCREVCKAIHDRDEFEDAVSQSTLGLILAIERWEPSRGYRFSTYATKWILQKYRRYQTGQRQTIRVSEHAIYKWLRIRKIYAEYERLHGRHPTDAELSQITGLTVEMICTVRDAQRIQPHSLNTKMTDQPTELIDMMPAGDSTSPVQAIMDATMADRLGEALCSLDDDTRSIIVRRFGLDGSKPETLQQIGSRYRTHASVIEARIKTAFESIRAKYDIEDLT